MANVIRSAMAWLAGEQREHASDTVVYRRGNASASVPAIIGLPSAAIGIEVGGTRIKSYERVFFIRAEDLVLSNATIAPLVGDTIDVSENGSTNRYRVSPPNTGEPESEIDAWGIQYRISTKFQKEV